MHTRKQDGPRAPRRGRGDDGVALVEFALISILLFTLLFGVIGFGMTMSFRGSLQQAASEGARAAAVAPRVLNGDGTYNNATVKAKAVVARDAGLGGYGKACGNLDDDIACTVKVHRCSDLTRAEVPISPATGPDCVTVELTYDEPYPVDLPFVPSLTLKVSSTEQLNTR